MAPKQTNNKKQLLPFISPFLSSGFQRSQEDSDIDWSIDSSQAPALPFLHVASASEHIPLSYVPSHNKDSNSKNRAESTTPLVLNYSKGQPAISCNWDGAHHVLSIFGTENTLIKDSEMIFDSIVRLRSFIKHYPVDKSPMERELLSVIKYLWKLFDTIYSAK